MLILLIVSLLVAVVSAQVQSPTHQYNVTSPSVNAPYVASQILPCIYDVSALTTPSNLQLSISLVGVNFSVLLVASADISQGFSFQKNIGGATIYEHQFNYNIPVNTTAGAYQVVFFDHVSKTNVTIPITIAAAPKTPTISSLSSGSITFTPTSSVSSSIFSKENSAVSRHQMTAAARFLCFICSLILIVVVIIIN